VKPLRTLTALGLALIVAAPASATHGGIHPRFKTQQVYFHCTGDTPIYNVNWIQQLTASTAYGRWDTSPPVGSVTDGEGCAAADAGWVTNEVYDPVFEGTFTGNLRDMTVRVHDFVANNDRDAGAPVTLRIYAEIDGISLFPRGITEGGYDGRTFTVTPSRINSGLTDFFEFTVTDIGSATEVKDAAGNVIDVKTKGAALEDGDGTFEHTIKLIVGIASFPGEEPQTTGWDVWAWDTTEVPSGITFNPATPAAAKVKADSPDFG
jgi:hypothetical protein